MIEGEWDVTKGTVKKFTQALIQEIKNKRAERKNKKGEKKMAEKKTTNFLEESDTVHIWLGSFDAQEKLEEYANNCKYECDDLLWDYYKKEMPLEEILTQFLEDIYVSVEVVLEACAENHPDLKKANAVMFVFGWKNKPEDIKKLQFPMKYVGEFEMEEPEPDVDGPYEGSD